MMKNNVDKIVKEYGLQNCVSIVAVSGGMDSVVLLHILTRILPADKIIVAHVNHGFRKESALEATFVKDLAVKYGLEYFEKKLKLSKKNEELARTQRYQWLRQLAKKKNAGHIITAHHLNDQAETIILNIARGAGPLDVWGMKQSTNDILRPLLGFTKDEILKYAKKNRLKYYEDASNKDINFSRNRIRHLVIPELLKINPGFFGSISREVELGQESADFFQGHMRKVKSRVVLGNKIDISKLNKLHPFIAKEVIRQVMHETTGKKADVYQKNILAVYDLVDKKGTKETKLGKLTIKKTYKYLIFGEIPATTSKSKKLTVGEDLLFNSHRITSRFGVSKPSKNNILLPEEFSGNLRVRTWRKGDKIKAEFGSKKIQDVFVDAKIESADRLRWPIVTHKGEIVWAPKLIASKYAQKKGRSLILEVR